MSRRAVITGIGVVAPGETGRKAFWELLVAGRTATRRISSFDPTPFRSQIAAECDFDPIAAGLSPQEAAQMDRAAQLAVVASQEAIADSALDWERLDPARIGVVLGSAVGCTTALEQEYVRVSDGGQRWLVDPAASTAPLHAHLVPSSIVRDVAWQARAEGPSFLVSNGCTSGLDVARHGLRLIRTGQADIVLAGATDAPISPITVACFDAIKATSARNDDPQQASRPFDLTRDGFVLGEGAAVLVLEDADHARRRGAHVYAELAGTASRANAFHMTGLAPHGRELAKAIELALQQAEVAPDEVDYVNAHGSGTRQNDRHESAAIKRALGDRARRVPVSSIKSMVGHSLGAIGSIELAACALAIENGIVPPTANLHTADPECDLDYVPLHAREQRSSVVVSVGSGFGGFQSAVVLTAPGRLR